MNQVNIEQPNPGSKEAVKAGCTCPQSDNTNGKGCGYVDTDDNPLFWIEVDCPIHGDGEQE